MISQIGLHADTVQFGGSMEINVPQIARYVYGDEPVSCLTAFPYLWRRFGPPISGSDPGKEIASYILTTGMKSVSLGVSCTAGSIQYAFSFVVSRDTNDEIVRQGEGGKLTREVCDALENTMDDLLRPVMVRDIPINILGKWIGSGISEWSDEEWERYVCERSPLAGRGISLSGGGA